MSNLATLRRIIQDVDAIPDLGEALNLVVKRVCEELGVEACSIFLVDDESSEYFLVATSGLVSKRIKQPRIKLGEGMVGLIGDRGEPINLEDSQTHESYLRYPGLDESNLHGFLGAPFMYQRELLGVLTIQRQEAERFDEEIEAFLVTLSIQLAAAMAHAKATGGFASFKTKRRQKLKEATFSGVAGAPGVAIGTAVVVYPLADLDAVPIRKVKEKDIDAELDLFKEALKTVREQMKRMGENLSTHLSEEDTALFDAYLNILRSASLTKQVRKLIREGNWAQGALREVIKRHIAQFEAMEDPYLRERATDIKDIGQRLLFALQSGVAQQRKYPENTILVGEEVTPSALAEVPEEKLAGVVSLTGSANSHVAILSRSLGLPTVMGAGGMPITLMEGHNVIIDGYYGQVYVSPSSEVRDEFTALLEEERELDAELEVLRDQSAETKDGYGVSLYVNTGLIADIGRALSVGAEGVGLYRTEVPFMLRDRFPSEEEQRVLYRQLLGAFKPRPVMMRTLDIGGDKALPYFPVEEDNPFLGWRGIRITLDHPEIFLVQARAMLRASEGYENLHIMLPMITNVAEVEESIRLLKQAHEELIEEGFEIKFPAIGVMIEAPSPVIAWTT